MPAITQLLARRAGLPLKDFPEPNDEFDTELLDSFNTATLERRIDIPCCNDTSPPGLIEAETVDPWRDSGKYALGWTYFALILLVLAFSTKWFHFLNDKVRTAVHRENSRAAKESSPQEWNHEMTALPTDKSTRKLFPREAPAEPLSKKESSLSTSRPLNSAIAFIRYVTYRSIPSIRTKKGWRPIVFPSIGATAVIFAALAFTLCYSFGPQPLYWQSIRFGSPPIAVRSGMIAVAMMPWIVALSMKANFISMLTGIGHERLNVLHRWAAYTFLLLSLIHTIPFYITPIWDQGGQKVFNRFFEDENFYIYGSGIAALVPLLVLCVHSLPPLRNRFYELFVVVHIPVSIVFLGMLFWHCNNYLTSWNYLWATMAIWISSYIVRIFYLNWTNPFRMSCIVGEEAAVTVLPEDAIKLTIPTQMRWKPGQYVYLRMPGVSLFENHPFTIASLCSDDYPSAYGEEYRDMMLVFRPFGGFTKKVLEKALDHGPWRTYRVFLDGPYGGMRRNLESFDHVVLVSGGSGITAIVSQLLELVKRMRDGKAVTKTVHLIWAMKRPETMEWFKEELRICREFAPPDTVHCSFYVTTAKRQGTTGTLVSAQTPTRPVSMMLHDRVNNVFQNIASNRYSTNSTKRHSALIRAEATGDPEKERQLREENDDHIRPLPVAHLKPTSEVARAQALASLDQGPTRDLISEATPHMPPHPTLHEKRRSKGLTLDIPGSEPTRPAGADHAQNHNNALQNFDFGFPATPTEFQKNLMRFAFMPAAAAVKSRKSGWSTEWGRPDVPHMLRELSEEWTGKRAGIFVCGPAAMRVDVSRTVAAMQSKVLDGTMEEVFLHAENYAV